MTARDFDEWPDRKSIIAHYPWSMTRTVPSDGASKLTGAFPAAVRADALAAVEVMPGARHEPVGSFTVQVDTEPVTIPYRLYHTEPASAERLTTVQRTVLSCLYTRHHDGHLRQRSLRQIITSPEHWVAPFVIQLIGEYVLEILLDITQGLDDVCRPATAQHAVYGQFLADNPNFLYLTSQRITSYWNEFYRGRYPRFRDYPGHELRARLQAAAAHYRR